MKVTMTAAICQEGMDLLKGAEIYVANDAHPHNYPEQLKDTDIFIVRVADKGAIDEPAARASAMTAWMWRRPPAWASPWSSPPAPTTAAWPSTWWR